MATVHIIHTNDLHSHFENWPLIVETIDTFKRQLPDEQEVILVDLGDHVDRSHIFTEATAGKGNVTLLNAANFQYATIGNNEGITLSHEQLDELYDDARFEVILSNFFQQNGKRPRWAKPYAIHTTGNGHRIGFIGVTAAYDEYYSKLGWHVTDPIDTIRTVLKELEGQTDALVCLAHVGRSIEEEIAVTFPQIHLILGAHTHHIYPDQHRIQSTSLSAGGKWGQYLGFAELTFKGSRLEDIQTRLVDLQHPTSEQKVSAEKHHESWQRQGEDMMKVPLFESSSLLEVNWMHDSSLSQRLGEALLSYTGADCALFPAGLLLTDLPEGEITALTMHRLLPHPINPCVITCTGAELIEAYQIAQNSKWPSLEVKGLGFRGKQLGKLLFYQFERSSEGYLVRGKPIELQKNYQLVTVDMFTFGYFFPHFKELPKRYFMPETIRDVFISYHQHNS